MANDKPLRAATFLEGIDLPAHKDDLIEHVRRQGADEDVVATLERLPDKEIEGPFELSRALGEIEIEIGREEREQALTEPLAREKEETAMANDKPLRAATFLEGIDLSAAKNGNKRWQNLLLPPKGPGSSTPTRARPAAVISLSTLLPTTSLARRFLSCSCSTDASKRPKTSRLLHK
jgi:hypothetical protein